MKLFKHGWKLSGNIYWALFLRLLLAMALFSLCRVGFYMFNASFFPEMTFVNLLKLMAGGLRFDLTAILYVNLLFLVLMTLPFNFRFRYDYQEVVKYVYFITNGLALAANVCDFIYYKFTLRRTTADIFKQFKNEQNITQLVFHFLVDYWYALLFWVFLIVMMVRLYNRIKVWGPQTRNAIAYYILGIVAIPAIAFFVIGGIRGGFRHSTRPITLSNAGEYVRDPKEISIVLNTPFTLIRTIGRTKVQKVSYYPEKQLDSIYTPVHVAVDNRGFQPKNVVVIILESFSKEFFGAFNRDKENGAYRGYTPFLDSLIQFSRTYEFSFANGRKSIDGLPSVIASIPSLGVPYFLSPHSGDKINSIPSLLRTRGYHTSFFHGAPNGSMGFNAFANLAGIERYYGMTEYGNDDDFDGLWGIWDEKFFQFYANKLNEFPEPFFSSIFSVSSHHPFKIPEEYENKFTGGPLPIHRCIQYTDYSLKKFFEKISSMPWYKNTIFVITADHTSSNIQFPEYRTAWGLYSIPIIFFTPDQSLTGREGQLFQQIDIMPTLMGYLGFDQSYIAFGRDAIREKSEPFVFNYKDNAYQLFQGDYLFIHDGAKALGLYNFKTDKLIEKNVLDEYPAVAKEMETKLKAIIQQYNNRMIEDRLTVEVKHAHTP